MITDELLLNAGYNQYKPNSIFHPFAELGFQKRIDDEIGKKYFITCYKYADERHPSTGEIFKGGYEFDIQLKDKEKGFVNILLFAGWDTIEAVEKRAEDFWNMSCWKYYERFE